MQQPMEDNFADVVSKAQRGLGLSDSELATRAGISREQLADIKAEVFDAGILRMVAPVLHLDAGVLAALPEYRPAPISVPGLEAFTTRYGGMRVNAYVVYDQTSGKAAAFDTGADATPILEFLRARSLSLFGVFLTHTHGDHVGDVENLTRSTGATAWVSDREPMHGARGFEDGRGFECGPLRIETLLTCGHTRGGTSYAVYGLDRPVVVVGDALFAGSMGGAMVSYADALRTNRENLLTLPAKTVICPGHGPLTTVAEERAHNPFFAMGNGPE